MSDTPPTDREAQLREQANRWSRSETGWERRAGESLSAALLILDGQRDIDAWLAREVIKLRARVAEMEAAARPFARGHEYADTELSGRADRDSLPINPYDPDSPTYGDCRRLAAILAAKQVEA